MNKMIKKTVSAILLCSVLAGCSNSTSLPEEISEPSKCPISMLRTGTQRQGIKTYGNGFECTETGSYFMCKDFTSGSSCLLYVDHDSDNVIKLCGRPDCSHTGIDCNAVFESANNVCYYNGFIYTFDMQHNEIVCMKPDGTERTSVYSISSFADAGEYAGTFDTKIFNGIFIVTLMKLDENGNTIHDSYYCKLDGSMGEPKPIKMGFFMYADGESFVGPVDYDTETNIYTYGIWDPDKGVIAELFKTDSIIGSYGYIGTKAHYYIENGIMVEDSYAEGKKEHIDTGLKGNYQLACFPDCIVAYKYLSEEESTQNITLDEVILHFYNWDYNDIGSVKVNYPFHEKLLGAGFICGETPERIILTNDFDLVPRYYINKSDLGTGNIEIHSFILPDEFNK